MTENREYLARLPAELVFIVAEDRCLSTRDLLAFARANSRYAAMVIPALYRKNIKDEYASALLWAVLKEDTRVMGLLIRYGADINSVEASTHLYQRTPYRWIRLLRRWDPHTQDNNSRQMGSQASSTQWLVASATNAAPASRDWRDEDERREFKYSALALAARKGLTKAVEWLLEHGADPEVPSQDLCACDNEPKMSGAMWRVPHQAVGSPMDQPQWTALHLAVHYGYDGIVQLLVAHGADTRQVCRPEDGPCSALHTAFICGRMAMAESLMYSLKGASTVDINARGRAGITPLHIAYCHKSTSLVDLALKFGAYVNLEYEIDRNQWTLFSMACAAEDWGFALRLLKLGANVDFDLDRGFGGRWTTNDLRREIMERFSRGVSLEEAALMREMDRITRDHEVAWL